MVEIIRVLQEAAIEVSGPGEEHLSPTTQKTTMIMQFEGYTINVYKYIHKPASLVAWQVVRVPMKINFVGSGLTECTCSQGTFSCMKKSISGKRESVS